MFSIDVFKDKKAPAYALLITTLKKYGLVSIEWDPAFLRDEIRRDYDIELSDLQHNKIQAAMSVLTSDAFEEDWRCFEVFIHLFNNQTIDYDDVHPVEAEEIAHALAEVMLIKKDILDDDEKVVYGDEVRAYAGHVFWNYGLHKAPDIFSTAIMPTSNKSDDKPKNESLQEIFDTHVEFILEYLEKIE